jgi:hypothetical protein
MPNDKATDDRRKRGRLRLQDVAFVILSPSDAGVGRLIDISLDGLSFDYVTTQEPSGEPNELEIFVTDSAFRLYRIPCRTITDLKTFEIPQTRSHRRRSGVQFTDLTPTQKSQIQYFIQKYTTEEVSQERKPY